MDEDAKEIEQSHKIIASIFSPTNVRVLYRVSILAQVREDQTRYVEADRLYREAFRLLKTQLPADNENLLFATWTLAPYLQRRGIEHAEARTLFREAVRVSLGRLGGQAGFIPSPRKNNSVVIGRSSPARYVRRGTWQSAECCAIQLGQPVYPINCQTDRTGA